MLVGGSGCMVLSTGCAKSCDFAEHVEGESGAGRIIFLRRLCLVSQTLSMAVYSSGSLGAVSRRWMSSV